MYLLKKMKPSSFLKENMDTSLENFLESLKNSVKEEDKIENEDQLRLAQGRQIMEHREKRLEAELEKSRNQLEELTTDRSLKKKVAFWVFALLFFETVLLFVILLFQGFLLGGFNINETTLNIFVPATIIQVSSMAIIITKYLFSVKK